MRYMGDAYYGKFWYDDMSCHMTDLTSRDVTPQFWRHRGHHVTGLKSQLADGVIWQMAWLVGYG